LVRANIEDRVKPRSDIAAERVALFPADTEIGCARARLGEAVLIVVIVIEPDARFEGDDASTAPMPAMTPAPVEAPSPSAVAPAKRI
jgi:hypothetical protein